MKSIAVKTAAVAGAFILSGWANATILTFDIPNLTNFQNAIQDYGDNVTGLVDGTGSYGVGAEGFTANITAEYGTIDPAYWTSGYSDLTNVLFDDADSRGPLELILTADAGYSVALYDFDLGAFGADRTVTSVRVTDETSTVLFESLGDTISGATHSDYFFSSPLSGQSLTITIDQILLGGASDDVALDNIRFGQFENQNAPVPEPATMTLLGMGLVGLAARRRKTA